MAIPGMTRQIVPNISEEASSMHVFDTWLDNRDRLNAGNIILGMDMGSDIVRCAYIDFAQSMSFSWSDTARSALVVPAPLFPGVVAIDREAVEKTVTAIEALPEGEISSLIMRLPDLFISPQRKACILDGLLVRRAALRGALLNVGGALT